MLPLNEDSNDVMAARTTPLQGKTDQQSVIEVLVSSYRTKAE